MKAAKFCFQKPEVEGNEESTPGAGEDLMLNFVCMCNILLNWFDGRRFRNMSSGPRKMRLGKYHDEGFASEGSLMKLGLHQALAGPVAKAMNMGVSKSTKDQYRTAVKHIERAEKTLGLSLNLPWNVSQTLNYVGFLLEFRNCSSKTIGCYLSAIRMLHLCHGLDPASLRPNIVGLVLKGHEHHEEARATLERKQKRVAVTVQVLKLLLRKIKEAEMTGELKTRLWLICCLMWNASLRVSEVLSKQEREFDPLTTLCEGDVECAKIEISPGRYKEILRYHIKSAKERRIGNGIKLEIFENGSFCCPVRAWKVWRAKVVMKEGQPMFMDTEQKCFTGKAFNKILSKLTLCLTDGTDGMIKSHSFRSGVATEMGRMGFTEQEIMAQGRWSSQAFKSYTKLGMVKRLQLAERMRSLVCE